MACSSTPSRLPAASSQICDVTLPNGSTPPSAQPSRNFYGNGQLWTALAPDGNLRAKRSFITSTGEIAIKFPWYRAVSGELTITGRRLDGPAPPLRAHIPEYGPTGFQSTELIFPRSGCWQVSAKAGTGRLTFVTLVTLAPEPTVGLTSTDNSLRIGALLGADAPGGPL